jgi:hypothetical protein
MKRGNREADHHCFDYLIGAQKHAQPVCQNVPGLFAKSPGSFAKMSRCQKVSGNSKNKYPLSLARHSCKKFCVGVGT